MVLNPYIITYLVCAFISALIGVVASLMGFAVWRRWNLSSASEEQYRLEKIVYLIITILSLGFFLRLLNVPLWFWTLHSMIVSIPGAMCLVGVHNIAVPVSYLASGMKLIVPVFYGYWLILNFLDRKVMEQPFMNQKLLLLLPLGLLVLIETGLDSVFLLSVPPRQVSCCTSLFDLPARSNPMIIQSDTGNYLLSFFYGGTLLILADIYLFLGASDRKHAPNKRWNMKKATALIRTVFAFLTFAAFIAALHTTISPLLLQLPFHHCVFCLGQYRLDVLTAFCLIFAGLSLFIIAAWLKASLGKWTDCVDVITPIDRTVNWAGILLLVGTILLSIPIVISMKIGGWI